MRGTFIARLSGAVLALWSAAAGAAPGQAPSVLVIRTIQPGQWELREVGSSGPPKLMCLSDPDTLIQLRHAGAVCTRFVVANEPQEATVNYSCNGAGNGRTTIHLDTPRQLRLQTQGIAQSAPFDMDYNARRLGDCGASAH